MRTARTPPARAGTSCCASTARSTRGYPGEALIVAFLLAFVPYLLILGPVNRIARRWFPDAPSGGPR